MTISDVTKIRNNIIEKISNSQEIKRMMYYTTPTPLEQHVIDLNNKKVEQPDLEQDFIFEEHRIFTSYNKEAFNGTCQVYIVCRIQECDFQESTASIAIDIICPKIYSIINQGLDRESAIGDRICTLIKEIKGVVVTKAINSNPDEYKDYNIMTLFLKVNLM